MDDQAMSKGQLIRELERCREELASRVFYETLLNSAGEAIVATDPDLRVIFWNRFAEKLFGWAAEEVTGRKVTDLMIPRISQRRTRAVVDTLRRRRSWVGELPIRRKDGTEFLALVTATPMEPGGSPAGGFIGVCVDISQRRRAEQELRESRDLMQMAEEIADLGHWSWEVSSGAMHWSDHLYRILGLDPARVGASVNCFWEAVHPDDRPPEGEARRLALETAIRRGEVEYRIVRPDGSVRSVLTKSRVTERDEDGKPALVIGTIQDVTERRAAEDALLQSETRLAEAQRVAKIGSWEWDVRTGDVFWSDEVYRIFGLQPGEGKPSYELARSHTHPEDTAHWERTVAKALESEDWFRCDYRAVRRDGEVIWIHDEGEVRRDVDGRPLAIIGTAQDVTGIRRTVEALERKNYEFELIFDSVPTPLFLKDRDGRFLRVNRAFARSTGISERECIGKMAAEVLSRYADQYASDDAEVFRTGEPKTGLLRPYESPVGVRWTLTDKIPYRDPQGRVCGLVGSIVDITDRKNLEDELARNIRGLQVVNAYAVRASRMSSSDELCRLASQAVGSTNPRAFVIVSYYDPAAGGPRVQAVAGPRRKAAKVMELLGGYPLSVAGRPESMGGQARKAAPSFTAGRLEGIPGGLMTLADGMLPRETCEKITEYLGIESVYSVGLSLDKEIVGGVSVLLPRGQSLQHGKAIETIARHLAVMLHRLRTEQRLRQSENRFRELARHFLHLREDQNAEISRELHDDLGQSLTALAMDLTLVEHDLRGERGAPDVLATADTLRDMRRLLNETVSKVRNISHLLRPPILDSSGVIEALEWQLEEFRKRSGMVMAFRSDLASIDLTKAQALAVFRTVQEALTNCARHAKATRAVVEVKERQRALVITVRDNGVGFSPARRDSGGCLGILGMEEHMSSCGGSVAIESREGHGTTVRIRVPLEEEA